MKKGRTDVRPLCCGSKIRLIALGLLRRADLLGAVGAFGWRVRGLLGTPLGVDELAGRIVALVRVGAEVIALGLDNIAGQALSAVAVVVRERRAERGRA